MNEENHSRRIDVLAIGLFGLAVGALTLGGILGFRAPVVMRAMDQRDGAAGNGITNPEHQQNDIRRSVRHATPASPGTDAPPARRQGSTPRLHRRLAVRIGAIARELHDDTAQYLFAISREIDNFVRSDGTLNKQQLAFLQEMRQRIGDTLQGVRRFSQDLRPSIIDDLGLMPAVQWLIKQAQNEHGVVSKLTVLGDERRFTGGPVPRLLRSQDFGEYPPVKAACVPPH